MVIRWSQLQAASGELRVRFFSSAAPVFAALAALEPPAMLCNSCNAPFYEEGARNAHYRSEWHRYNLKRKVRPRDPHSPRVRVQALCLHEEGESQSIIVKVGLGFMASSGAPSQPQEEGQSESLPQK